MLVNALKRAELVRILAGGTSKMFRGNQDKNDFRKHDRDDT